MRSIRLPSKQLAISIFFSLCSVTMWLYWSHVVHTPHGVTNGAGAATASPLTDLYPYWYGTRELFLRHRDPYGAEVSHELQFAYYGRLLDPSRPGEPRDQQRFAYPLYVIFLVAPTIGTQFHSAQVLFSWVLAIVTAVSVALWLSVIPLQLSLLARVTLFAAVLSSVPLLQGVSLIQFGLLVAGLLCAAVAAVVAGHLFLAGALLALATIKPPMSLLAISWLMMWIAGDWRPRRPLLWGFAATLAVLIASSEFLVPGWLLRYPQVLIAYAQYSGTTPLIGVFLPRSLLWPVAVGGLVATASFCWSVRRQPPNSSHFILAFAFVSTLTVLIMPTALSPYNHVLLLPAVLLILHHWPELWSRGFLSRVLISLLAAVAILPWLLAPLVTVGFLMPRLSWLLNLRLAPLYVSLPLPFAVLGLLFMLTKTLPSISAISARTPNPSASGSVNTQATNG